MRNIIYLTAQTDLQRRHKTTESDEMIAVCVSTQQVGGSGACSARKFFKMRCSEIASEALLGEKLQLKNFL